MTTPPRWGEKFIFILLLVLKTTFFILNYTFYLVMLGECRGILLLFVSLNIYSCGMLLLFVSINIYSYDIFIILVSVSV